MIFTNSQCCERRNFSIINLTIITSQGIRSEKLIASVNNIGMVLATIHDYVYRILKDSIIETMNYWNLISCQEKCQLKLVGMHTA